MTNTNATFDLLRRAAEWRLIALLLERPEGDWAKQVEALKGEVPADDLRLAAQAAITHPVAAKSYDTIFGPGGPAAPREVSYRACLDGHFLAELAALYNAFAYQARPDDPPDHVAVQVDFVAYLLLKQAYALSRGDPESADVAADAARRVIDEHLCLIASPLARSLQASGIDYLAGAAAALRERVGPSPHRSLSLPLLDDQSLSGSACTPSAVGLDDDDDLCAPP